MIADAPPPAMVNVAPASYAGADVMLRAALVVVDGAIGAFCPAELFVYDDGPNVAPTAARGDQPGCRVYFRRQERNVWWEVWNDRGNSRAVRTDAAAYVCAVVAHERLHNQGLSHTGPGPGLMTAGVIQPNDYPAACWTWARANTPERTTAHDRQPEQPSTRGRARRASSRRRAARAR